MLYPQPWMYSCGCGSSKTV